MICYEDLLLTKHLEIVFKEYRVVVIRVDVRNVDGIDIPDAGDGVGDFGELKPAAVVNAFRKPRVVKNGDIRVDVLIQAEYIY
nr:hypothetical protein [Pseudomonas sp. BIGb0427]